MTKKSWIRTNDIHRKDELNISFVNTIDYLSTYLQFAFIVLTYVRSTWSTISIVFVPRNDFMRSIYDSLKWLERINDLFFLSFFFFFYYFYTFEPFFKAINLERQYVPRTDCMQTKRTMKNFFTTFEKDLPADVIPDKAYDSFAILREKFLI